MGKLGSATAFSKETIIQQNRATTRSQEYQRSVVYPSEIVLLFPGNFKKNQIAERIVVCTSDGGFVRNRFLTLGSQGFLTKTGKPARTLTVS
jgi:hypothetical protein